MTEKEKHYHAILQQIIDHVSNSEDNDTTIRTLIRWGFEKEDLLEFDFNRDDIERCINTMDDFVAIY